MTDSRVWKKGLPPGKYYDGMIDDYEVAFAPLAKWHRRRSSEDAAKHREERLARAALTTGEAKND